MSARWIVLLVLWLAACGGSDPSAKKEEGSTSAGYDLPAPPADDEKKK